MRSGAGRYTLTGIGIFDSRQNPSSLIDPDHTRRCGSVASVNHRKPKAKWTAKDIPEMTGKACVVTGGNSGVVRETVKARPVRAYSVTTQYSALSPESDCTYRIP